jgi:hypothetical protein
MPVIQLDHPAAKRENKCMNTEFVATDRDVNSEHADTGAVLRHAFDGFPLDPEVGRRVDERAARITEQIRRTHGIIDDETFQALLTDDDA